MKELLNTHINPRHCLSEIALAKRKMKIERIDPTLFGKPIIRRRRMKYERTEGKITWK
ncbi:MAG: hypothetical protein P0116_08730 [Candidatus Nitrosocosmicus sp.]|nr:hypothetical protein [Candidatus Nitrosocosmicus sp.]